ncbi:MAG: 3-deoxy-manno-octulosonate cytidylyltransferase [Alphaproteobacteria bacterium]|nr:3-deoxy-manno-octulosonate cytidylyltransferase [Alphaproteobacteria bacterium]
MNPIILIPARLASTRLPNKPLAMIGGLPMIVQVWRRAVASKVGEVVVACDSPAIKDAVEQAGGRAVLTDPDLPSGSDRIDAALRQIDPAGQHDVVVNVQGDMPLLEPSIIARAAALLDNKLVDIGTLCAPLQPGEMEEASVVKVVVSGQWTVDKESKSTRAKLFTRSFSSVVHRPPSTDIFHHIGVYAYQRDALERFVKLPPSENEKHEKLEQLRAMDAGMRIDVAVVDVVPLGVDTPQGLEKARAMIEST